MAAYAAFTLSDFALMADEAVLDQLLRGDSVSGFAQVSQNQIEAWRQEIQLLRNCGRRLMQSFPVLGAAGLVFEYQIPRREKRIDVVLLLIRSVVVLEFKVGARVATPESVVQVTDYALDLAYYHAASQGRAIVPIVCPTAAPSRDVSAAGTDTLVAGVGCSGAATLPDLLLQIAAEDVTVGGSPMELSAWTESPYRPVPGIIEATVGLFAGHAVSDIATTLADHATIREAVAWVQAAVVQARERKEKVLCLLTGVPGAGKTLTGLQIAHSKMLADLRWGTVFLSGNGPLLKVLRAALARDYAERQRCSQDEAGRHAATLLHSVHSYLAEALKGDRPPAEHVVIFDEAQRAWDGPKMAKMAGRQRRAAGLDAPTGAAAEASARSEPAQILAALDRHTNGAVVVALCGNGQEIHDGEAGVAEWVTAQQALFPGWKLWCSPVAAELARLDATRTATQVEARLHLDVPLRAHRATGHSRWADAVLAGDAQRARENANPAQFPIVVTRDLERARRWLRETTRGRRRFGLVASSGASRLRPYGIEVSADFRKAIDYAQWFTAPRGDLRASYALEVAATEFECQGLELDRACLCWCWDLLLSRGCVATRAFRGVAWKDIRADRDRNYLLNKYRVLLTRGREGLVLWVPPGDAEDVTRSPAEADAIAEFLVACGARVLDRSQDTAERGDITSLEAREQVAAPAPEVEGFVASATRCPRCGALVPAGQKFCGECGAQRLSPPVSPLVPGMDAAAVAGEKSV